MEMRLRDTLPSQCSLSRCYPITKNSAAEDYVCFSFIAIIVNPISCPLMGTICILIEASLGSLYFSWIKLTLNSDDKEKTRHQIFGSTVGSRISGMRIMGEFWIFLKNDPEKNFGRTLA